MGSHALNPTSVDTTFPKTGTAANREENLALGPPSTMLAAPPGATTKVLGHSQISLTANLYTHLAPAMMRNAADRMDAALGGS